MQLPIKEHCCKQLFSALLHFCVQTASNHFAVLQSVGDLSSLIDSCSVNGVAAVGGYLESSLWLADDAWYRMFSYNNFYSTDTLKIICFIYENGCYEFACVRHHIVCNPMCYGLCKFIVCLSRIWGINFNDQLRSRVKHCFSLWQSTNINWGTH